MINIFGQEVSIWDNIENLRGNHMELSKLFPDGMHPSWAFVGDKKWVVTRNVHGTSGKVTFFVYNREDFINSQYSYLKKQKENNE